MKSILLVHLGRSGSTVLGNLVGQYPGLTWLGEVFTLAEQKGEEFRSENDLDNVFHKLQLNEPNAFGAEVKLINILKTVPEGGDSLNAVKKYLQYVHKLSDQYELTPVLLLRSNVLKRIVSCHAAANSGVWHIQNSEKIQKGYTLNLPINTLTDWDTGFTGPLNKVLLNGINVNRVLEKYFRDNCWNVLYYEKDIEKDPISSANKLIDIAAGSRAKVSVDLQVNFGRTNPSGLEKKLENYKEISTLINDDYRWMLVD